LACRLHARKRNMQLVCCRAQAYQGMLADVSIATGYTTIALMLLVSDSLAVLGLRVPMICCQVF
jgi:hypothetical protein